MDKLLLKLSKTWISLPVSKITFNEQAFQEYLYWQMQDKKTLKKINSMLKDIARNPYTGTGKPESLKGSLGGVLELSY